MSAESQTSALPTPPDFRRWQRPASQRDDREDNRQRRATAWQRFWRQRRARFSAVVLLLMVVAALFGPLLWPQSPSQQWLSSISTPPVGARTAVLVEPLSPSQALEQEAIVRDGDAWISVANTEQVMLHWPAGSEFQVYRHNADLPPPGLPLGRSDRGYFSDRLRISSELWVYTLRAEDGRQFRLAVTPEPALSLFEARLQNLSATPRPGQRVTLPAHPMGTDQLGRDMFSRLLEGARTSLFVGFVAPLLFIGFGAVYGAMAGLAGGWLDDVMMRIADFVVGLPLLLFMILFRVWFGFEPGDSGVTAIIVAMLLLSWPSSARLVRGQVLSLREQAFVQSARLNGASHFYLARKHLLPNLLPLLLVSLSFAIPQAIFTEAFLSFIGLGVSPPTASWGSLCNEGIRSLLTAPHELFFPALMISITVLAFNLIGEALRDAVDIGQREDG